MVYGRVLTTIFVSRAADAIQSIQGTARNKFFWPVRNL